MNVKTSYLSHLSVTTLCICALQAASACKTVSGLLELVLLTGNQQSLQDMSVFQLIHIMHQLYVVKSNERTR